MAKCAWRSSCSIRARRSSRRSRRRPATGRPGIALKTEIPDGPPRWIRSDRQKVVKILSKLIGNAYKFTTHGEVRATVQVLNELARFTVSDTGIGIPSAAQKLVFDEFRQVDGSTTRQYGGSGLGLALSRHLARLLGGDIQLESEPHEGSSFVVEIPLEFSHDPQPAVSSAGLTQQQETSMLQEITTPMAPAEVLAAAKTFFSRRSPIYAAFLEKEGADRI